MGTYYATTKKAKAKLENLPPKIKRGCDCPSMKDCKPKSRKERQESGLTVGMTGE